MFIVLCTDKPNHAATRAANRDAHLAHVKASGNCVFAGPMISDDGAAMLGSVLVYDMAERAQVEAQMAADPYVQAGLFESMVIRRFRQVIPGA